MRLSERRAPKPLDPLQILDVRSTPSTTPAVNGTTGVEVERPPVRARLAAHRAARERRREPREGQRLGLVRDASGTPRGRLSLQHREPRLEQPKRFVGLHLGTASTRATSHP